MGSLLSDINCTGTPERVKWSECRYGNVGVCFTVSSVEITAHSCPDKAQQTILKKQFVSNGYVDGDLRGSCSTRSHLKKNRVVFENVTCHITQSNCFLKKSLFSIVGVHTQLSACLSGSLNVNRSSKVLGQRAKFNSPVKLLRC